MAHGTTAQLKSSEICDNEERISLAMRGSNDGVWDWNLETNEVYYSPRWKSMLGYNEDELQATIDTWKAHVHPDDRDYVLEKAQDYLEGRSESFEVEMRMIHKDGSIVYVLSRAFLAHAESNEKPNRLVGTHVDITERKKSEQFILETSNILEMIAAGKAASDIYDAIALLYESRHPGLRCSMLVLVGNKLMHGGAPSLPKEYCDAVNGLENGPNVGSCGTSTYTGESVYVENIETDPKWAKIKHVALPHGMRCCWSEPIKNASGKVLGAFGMYYNYPALPNDNQIQDLKSAARLASIIMNRDHSANELIQYTKELERSNEELQQFAYAASHDLQEPCRKIQAFADRLLTKHNAKLDDEAQDYLSRIIDSGNRMQTLVQDLLSFSRVSSQGRPFKKINLQSVVEDVLSDLEISIQEAGGHVIVGDLPTLDADAVQMQQLFQNLIANGLKYRREKVPPIIQIGAKILNEDQQGLHDCLPVICRIQIQDNGIGFEQKYAKQIFNIFQRLHGRDKYAGTGVGLAVCEKIVLRHSGTIKAESAPGEGATFTIDLPMIQSPADEKPAHSPFVGRVNTVIDERELERAVHEHTA